MRILRWAGRLWTAVLVVVVLLAALLLGLRLLLPLFERPPSLAESIPASGAAGVSSRTTFTLRFDRPMNPRSVERAIATVPPFEWSARWSDEGTTLTISPTQSLRPDTDYHVSIGAGALSRRLRAIAQPMDLRFHTAPAPAVVQVLPADGATDVPDDSPISIRFSRPIVAAAALLRPQALPDLRIEPPVAGTVIWLNQTTALFRPAEPLKPSTRYRATLGADLADLSGGQLGSPFDWSFSTPAPRIVATAPADGATIVAPSATLLLTISQPLDLDSLRASLAISPTVAGDLAATNLPDGRQVVAYAPFSGWQPGTDYSITLQSGARPAEGNLPLQDSLRLSFTTAPRPALIARFPGEGQTLPAGQSISLVFNTPIDAGTFRGAVRFDPPAGETQVSTSDSEVRIAADLRAATVYTMTVPATLTDRNGVPLGQDYRIRFLTAPAAAALALPEAPAHLAQVSPGQPAGLLVRRTNLSAIDLGLYQLDETTTIRTLGFTEGDWGGFQPERYGQPLLRSWRVPLADPLNAPAEGRVPLVTAEGAPLPVGAYYLRLRTLEGPRADLLLLVARTRLTLQARGDAALIWATDIISGTPIGGLPISLYQGGALVQQGTTGLDGVFRFARTGDASLASYVAITGAERYGAVSGAWGTTVAEPGDGQRIFLTTDRAAYQAGERVQLAGFVRDVERATGALSRTSATSILTIARPIDNRRLYQETLTIQPTGVFSGSFSLSADTPPGDYIVAATIDDEQFQAHFTVVAGGPPPLAIVMRPLAAQPASQPLPVAIDVRTPEGLPVAGATISWTLDAQLALPAETGGYVFGDDDQRLEPPPARAGVDRTGPDGRYTLVISDTAADLPLQYRLAIRTAGPGGLVASSESTFLTAPARVSTGIRLPSRIFSAGRPGQLELLARMPDGSPADGAALRVEIYRRTWERAEETDESGAKHTVWRPRDQLAQTRRAVTGADGRVGLALTLPTAGAYRLRAVAVGGDGRAASAQTLWTTSAGFAGWDELPGGGPLLIADRPSYRPGETARLLVAMPFSRANALLTYGAAAGLETREMTLRAGEPLTLTVQPGMSDIPVAVLLAPQLASTTTTAAAPLAPPLAESTLAVESDRQTIGVTIATDRETYQPGATATLTVTTADALGAAVSADVLVGVVGASGAPATEIARAFQPGPAPLLSVPAARGEPATSQPPAPKMERSQPQLAAHDAGLIYWNPALRTSRRGALTLTVRLPVDPARLEALVWAASDSGIGQTRASLVVTRPLSLSIEAPPELRAGDETVFAAHLTNTDPVSHEVEVGLQTAGLRLIDNGALIQHVVLAPGGQARITWQAQILDASGVALSMSARSPGLQPLDAQLQQPILSTPAAPHGGGVALLREYLDPNSGQPLDPATLRTGQLVRVRLTALASAAQPALAVEDQLPGGATLVSLGAGDFELVEAGPGNLTLRRGTSPTGIYQHSYLMRIVAAGRYGVPPPIARTATDVVGAGNALTVDISGP